jgi:hypothetical protein
MELATGIVAVTVILAYDFALLEFLLKELQKTLKKFLEIFVDTEFLAGALISECPSINGLFARSRRYAQKIILGISTICLWLFFSHALISNKNPHLWMDTSEDLFPILHKFFHPF